MGREIWKFKTGSKKVLLADSAAALCPPDPSHYRHGQPLDIQLTLPGHWYLWCFYYICIEFESILAHFLAKIGHILRVRVDRLWPWSEFWNRLQFWNRVTGQDRDHCKPWFWREIQNCNCLIFNVCLSGWASSATAPWSWTRATCCTRSACSSRPSGAAPRTKSWGVLNIRCVLAILSRADRKSRDRQVLGFCTPDF